MPWRDNKIVVVAIVLATFVIGMFGLAIVSVIVDQEVMEGWREDTKESNEDLREADLAYIEWRDEHFAKLIDEYNNLEYVQQNGGHYGKAAESFRIHAAEGVGYEDDSSFSHIHRTYAAGLDKLIESQSYDSYDPRYQSSLDEGFLLLKEAEEKYEKKKERTLENGHD